MIVDRRPEREKRAPRLVDPPRLMEHLDPLECAKELRLVDHRRRKPSPGRQLLRRSTRTPGLLPIVPKKLPMAARLMRIFEPALGLSI